MNGMQLFIPPSTWLLINVFCRFDLLHQLPLPQQAQFELSLHKLKMFLHPIVVELIFNRLLTLGDALIVFGALAYPLI